ELALRDVAHVELPALRRLVEPGEEALALFFLGDVQEELEDQRAALREVTLESADALEALVPDVLRHQLARQALARQHLRMHPRNQHILVVRAVEDADAPALRQRLGDAPEKIMIELFGARLLEGMDLAALRIDARHHVLDRAVLAGRIHRLKY